MSCPKQFETVDSLTNSGSGQSDRCKKKLIPRERPSNSCPLPAELSNHDHVAVDFVALREGGSPGGATHIWAPGTAILTLLISDRDLFEKVDWLREGCRVRRFRSSCRCWLVDGGRSVWEQSISEGYGRAAKNRRKLGAVKGLVRCGSPTHRPPVKCERVQRPQIASNTATQRTSRSTLDWRVPAPKPDSCIRLKSIDLSAKPPILRIAGLLYTIIGRHVRAASLLTASPFLAGEMKRVSCKLEASAS